MKLSSFCNYFCQHAGCTDRIGFNRTTERPLIDGEIPKALRAGAIVMGWRHIQGEGILCPTHADTRNAVCLRCGSPGCSCIGGPRWEARRAEPGEFA